MRPQRHTNTGVCSVYKKITRMLFGHVTRIRHKKKQCVTSPVTLAGPSFTQPRGQHTHKCQHTHSRDTNACMHKHFLDRERLTHPTEQPSRLREPSPDLCLPQSKGCCSPAYNSTTDPMCSSCKFCSFSSPGGSEESCVVL